MGDNILEIKQLCVDFLTEDKSTNAVIDFSLSIKNDEILGLVGESGSGKSTVIKSIPYSTSTRRHNKRRNNISK